MLTIKYIKLPRVVNLICLTILLFTYTTTPVYARLSYFGEWQTKYSNSDSDLVGCQLCHQSTSGGDGWNEYGWAVRSEFLNNGGVILNAFSAVESINSDGDPSSSSNIEEINLHTQPGWTSGLLNTIYFKNGDTADQPPPAQITTLDPEIATIPNIEIAPVSLNFSNTVNTSDTNLVTVTNTGDANLNITSIVFCPDSSTSAEYSLLELNNFSISPSSSESIQVSYTPVDIGYDGGCLQINSNDPDQPQIDIALTGQGLAVGGDLIDIDSTLFAVSPTAQVGYDPISISLSVINNGQVSGSVKATVSATLLATEIYSEEMVFESGLNAHTQIISFPDYFPPSAGDIVWQAIIHDQDLDVDETDAITTVTSSALLDPIPEPIAQSNTSIAFETVASGLIAPNYATHAPGNPNQLYVVDQPGQVWRINLLTRIRYLFMDLSERLVPLGIFGPGSFDERGLLGLAFHPDYQANGLIYTFTSESEQPAIAADFTSTLPPGINANHQAVITEWTVTNHTLSNGFVDMTDDISSGRRVLLRVDEPQFNHNGGSLAFGPDGLLYMVFGDGGGADDKDGQGFIGGLMVGHGENGNGQNTSNPLGAILRIDPLGSNSVNGQYGIPSDNPFVNTPFLGLDEIYAYGLRNAFRMSFDSKTGTLYSADVGQNDIEEVNIIVNGGNYGWNSKEGSFFFNSNQGYSGFVHNNDPGNLPNLIDPILQYDHDEGISIIGGFVYRGKLFKQLKGSYVFGDWSASFSIPSGRLFHQYQTSNIHEFKLSDRDVLGLFLHGFGQDSDGEIYIIGNSTGTPFRNSESVATGQVLKMVPAPKSKGSRKK